ncbi:MAG: cohesin domain-containing protein [Candidatus Eisenbacteria bacterium]
MSRTRSTSGIGSITRHAHRWRPWASARTLRHLLAIPAGLVFSALLATCADADDVPEFHCFLDPSELCDVFIGDMVMVHFEVDSTAVQFNGYELKLQYDPNLLDFVAITEGPLMTEACITRFQNVTFTDSTVAYTHVLFCNGVSIDGPGRLCSMKFMAIAESQGETKIEIVSHPDSLFVDAGLWVFPEHATFPRQVVFLNDGETHFFINDPTSSGIADAAGGSGEEHGPDLGTGPDSRAGGSDLGARLLITPNPASSSAGRVEIALSRALREPARLELVSTDGRRVGGPWTLEAGRTELSLVPRTRNGRALEAGTYYLHARTASGGRALGRLVIVR